MHGGEACGWKTWRGRRQRGRERWRSVANPMMEVRVLTAKGGQLATVSFSRRLWRHTRPPCAVSVPWNKPNVACRFRVPTTTSCLFITLFYFRPIIIQMSKCKSKLGYRRRCELSSKAADWHTVTRVLQFPHTWLLLCLRQQFTAVCDTIRHICS
jgi:hypothetical protein